MTVTTYKLWTIKPDRAHCSQNENLMPAKDLYHDAVKNALIKDGWLIIADPYIIKYEDAELYADLAAEKPIPAERRGQKIVVEIKSFVGKSQMYDFQGRPWTVHRLS